MHKFKVILSNGHIEDKSIFVKANTREEAMAKAKNELYFLIKEDSYMYEGYTVKNAYNLNYKNSHKPVL